MKRNTKELEASITYLRIFATLLILLHHTLFLLHGWKSNELSGSYWVEISRFSKYLWLGIFFFISGMLVARSNYHNHIKKFIVTKFKRIILPAIIIATIYSLIYHLNLINTFFGSYIWYMPTLFILMLTSLLFYNKTINFNTFIKFITIVILLIALSKFVSWFFFNCICYIIVFYTGFYYDAIISILSAKNKMAVFIILNFILAAVYLLDFHNVLYPFVVAPILAIDIYLLFRNFKKIPKILLPINKYSFDIYLYQCFFLLYMYEVCISNDIEWPLSLIIVFFVTLFSCMLVGRFLSYSKSIVHKLFF